LGSPVFSLVRRRSVRSTPLIPFRPPVLWYYLALISFFFKSLFSPLSFSRSLPPLSLPIRLHFCYSFDFSPLFDICFSCPSLSFPCSFSNQSNCRFNYLALARLPRVFFPLLFFSYFELLWTIGQLLPPLFFVKLLFPFFTYDTPIFSSSLLGLRLPQISP